MVDGRDELAWLWDMQQACRAVVRFVDGKTFDDYESKLLLRSAVERQIEILGEAARRVSKQFQDTHSEIAWRPVIAQRHVLAYDYGEIAQELIWRVPTTHVPDLLKLLVPLVRVPPQDDQ